MTVLVVGATGKQGGSVARRLLSRGHHVRALTRKADSPAMMALVNLGAQVATGNLEDRASLTRAVDGVDAIFGMGTPFESGMDVEVTQGKHIADAAKAAGKYLVYTSVAGADQNTGIPHFESKWKVEQHIKHIGATAAVIAPVYFMENALSFGKEQLKEGVYACPMRPDRKLAQVALADIAGFAVAVLEDKARFVGTRTDIASEELTGAQAAEVLARVLGRAVRYFQVPLEAVRQRGGDDLVKMYEWFEQVGYRIDPAALRRDFSEVGWHSYESWAREQDWPAVLR
jgi:uncharacterized protein YbjT (DUF2867 family)